jgi:hypothetical protein
VTAQDPRTVPVVPSARGGLAKTSTKAKRLPLLAVTSIPWPDLGRGPRAGMPVLLDTPWPAEPLDVNAR